MHWLIPSQNVGFLYLENLYQCKFVRTLGSSTLSVSWASVLGIYILDLRIKPYLYDGILNEMDNICEMAKGKLNIEE